MNTTIWKVAGTTPGGDAAGRALRAAGIGVVEKNDWDEVAAALSRGEATLVVADADSVARSQNQTKELRLCITWIPKWNSASGNAWSAITSATKPR